MKFSEIVKDSDSGELPFYRTKTPDLVPEEEDAIYRRSIGNVLSQSTVLTAPNLLNQVNPSDEATSETPGVLHSEGSARNKPKRIGGRLLVEIALLQSPMPNRASACPRISTPEISQPQRRCHLLWAGLPEGGSSSLCRPPPRGPHHRRLQPRSGKGLWRLSPSMMRNPVETRDEERPSAAAAPTIPNIPIHRLIQIPN
ncbi:hypothetical protein MLD38_024982 [Melastoma candidum]|uniref:Uncharacterized protein n=1 Tax=Melastoma candidum TaxID=119954 RepID=A0ACB9NX10_9MYRT|nr:hypothetical protein MLD38_024982 [Melastoma candidum]